MKTINKQSRATVEFTLRWEHNSIQHSDIFHTNKLNMWRDYLHPDIAAGLMGRGEGEEVTIALPPHARPTPDKASNVIEIRSQQFYPPGNPSDPLTAFPGRFYPQGYLHGVDNVFEVSLAPARCLEEDKGKLIFDLNHPLAGHELTLDAKIIAIHETKTERGGRCEDWIERVVTDGPGMQTRYGNIATDFFTNQGLRRKDESADSNFYKKARMVQHLDSTARKNIRAQYKKLIQPGARVLDLMGSWDSHLPDSLVLEELTVLGMNKEELAANPQATQTVLHDLNENASLPFADNRFTAIVSTASVEYLTDPLVVFAEMCRVLEPGGVLAIAFSNRWFPPKAIQIWSEIHEFERLGLVLELFHRTPGFASLHSMTTRGLPRPEDDPYYWELPFSDPVFIAWGKKT